MNYELNNGLTVIVFLTVVAVVTMFVANRKNPSLATFGVAQSSFAVLLHELVSRLLN